MSKFVAWRLKSSSVCFVLFVMALAWPGCVAADRDATPGGRSVMGGLDPAGYGAARLAVVHYHRPDGDYDGWNLWAWTPGGEGAAHAFDGGTEAGVYAVVPVRDADATKVGFIVRKNEWEAKDVGRDRFVELAVGGNEVAEVPGKLPGAGVGGEVWIVSGDVRVYGQPGAIDLEAEAVAAFLDGDDAITLAVTGKLTEAQREGVRVIGGAGAKPYVVSSVGRKAESSGSAVVYTVRLSERVADGDIAKLSVVVPGVSGKVSETELSRGLSGKLPGVRGDLPGVVVYAREVLSAERFTPLEAELGAVYGEGATVFRVWSPVADRVSVLLEGPGGPGGAGVSEARALAMKPVGKGVWELEVRGDLHGWRYRFSLDSYGETRVVADIYARGATPDSTVSIVMDMDRTDPAGWGEVAPPAREHATDEVIYEVHVRDFTAADATAPAAHRGKYLGLLHTNPGDAARGEPATGLAHLEALGVSAVHLLPIQDFGSGRSEYNWGYWTTLFNVPESGYATDPEDSVAVSRELKTMVAGLHAAGLRVILDVVYNHTSSSGVYSAFDQTVPFYYFRTEDDGALRNDAGVGNALADGRPMVRKYIVDSLKYWTAEYGVDGFRFDLVGVHRPATVRAITEALLEMRGDLTLYGEPWTGGGPTYFGKGAQRGLDFAVFNDHLRNAIRGDLDGAAAGFATGPGGDSAAVARGVSGGIDDFADEPGESVSYVSAHDNLTLWDKIVKTRPGATEAERRAMHKLSLGIVLTSQGVAFLHGGSEFARSKGGEHNSYNKGDAVNALDWGRKAAYREVFSYAAGLVAMRRGHRVFRMRDDVMIRKHLRFFRVDGVVAYTLDGGAVGDDWGEVLVAYNGEPGERRVALPAGVWGVAVDAERVVGAGVASLGEVEGELVLPGYSMGVLFRE